jgi:hypothetical protein
MNAIEHWTIWLMPGSRYPYCVERGNSERHIAGVEHVDVVPAEGIESLRTENQRLREAIVDALADLTPGYSPYSLLAAAIDAEAHKP